MNGKYGFEAPEKITQGQRVRKVLMARNQASEAPEKVHKSQTFASGHHKKFLVRN